MESVGIEEERESLKCFRCDLGFWDVCYTTETNCSLGERCFTGRGTAGVMNETVFSPQLNNLSTGGCLDTRMHLFDWIQPMIFSRQVTVWTLRLWVVWKQRSAAQRTPWSSFLTKPSLSWPNTAVTLPSATQQTNLRPPHVFTSLWQL